MLRRGWRLLRRSVHRRTAHLPPTVQGLLWSALSVTVFSGLNAVARVLSQGLDSYQVQFLRYAMGLLVMLPFVLHHGAAGYRPQSLHGHLARGALHTLGLTLWFAALPRVPLADLTAIGFTTPLFVMVGAWLVFKEQMRWERWLATSLGFAGVLIVVLPQVSFASTGPGTYHLVMLASAPVFAASYLLTKALTRQESTGTILLWQQIIIAGLSLPLAVGVWQPLSAAQWAGFLACGVLGTLGHYALTKSLKVAEISSTQSVKFIELIWAALLGWVVFADVPTLHTLAGGLLIAAATIWVTRREARIGGARPPPAG
jgi:drug/metabolite transporter (DMT)-like permease